MDTIDTIHFSKSPLADERSPSISARVSRLAHRLVDAFAVWLQKRESRWTLRYLTDDELRDIGLTREEAMDEVNKSFFWD
ncbi:MULTISPECIES: DUF1127 domain-containing protein [unclassified Rhizobium]|uniref:DUF1127 domain-containing protein n=1 Tax=unclassified Rhizobium TaxID=2613769 RepID=UPI000CDF4619|nr:MULTISPECIES: DUF1127 domain-containing protein [Rhizobium]AVA21731.1 hypothetical protein NXC24_CH02093 [Rhizobium sp. NXC24]MDK4737657.1 DUF1127 domain-containing protein [Rhizobium sp. CNPSo 3464]UWU22792.1 DUF1127 domain-containing protein [Rhizobium tropici]